MSRQRLILTLVFGLLLLALGYSYWATPRQQKVTPKGPSPASPEGRGKSPVDVAIPRGTLRLDLLQRQEEDFPGFKRDLFSLTRPAPPAPPPPPPFPVRPLPPPPPVGAQEPGAMARALGQFTFLGFLQQDGQKTLFLGNQGEIFVAKKGDAFGKHKEFVITEVSSESLTIRQGNGPGLITVSLVEQRPLTPAPPRPQPPQPQRSGLPPMVIQPLPEDLARQAAEEEMLPPEPEEAQEPIEEEPVEAVQPLQFGPSRSRALAPAGPTPAGASPPSGSPQPEGLQYPGMSN